MITVTCHVCGTTDRISAIRLHLEDLNGWWSVWTCHAPLWGGMCGWTNRDQLRQGQAARLRAAGVEPLRRLELIAEARADHLPPLTEDDLIRCGLAWAHIDRLAPYAAARLEPEATHA